MRGAERGAPPPAGPPIRDGPRSLARLPLRVPPVPRPDRPRDRPHDRLPQLRDLRPQRPRPRQPLRPDLALRGPRHLALGRLPPQPRRRRRARRSATTSAPPSPRSCSLYGLVLCWRRRETALIAGLAAAALAYAAARIGGTPYTAAKAIEIGAPLAGLVIVLPLLRRPVAWLYLLAAARLLAAGARQRPGRSRLLHAGADRPASRRRRRPDPGARVAANCSPTNTAPPTSPGSCAAAASASTTDAEAGRPSASRRPLRRRRVAAGRPPFPGCAFGAGAALRSLGTNRPGHGPRPCPLIAVRQARQGPAR